jgi:competence protein ComEC
VHALASRPLAVLSCALLLGVFLGSGVAYFPVSTAGLVVLILGGVLWLSLAGRCSPVFGCLAFGVLLSGLASAALAQMKAEPPDWVRAADAHKVDVIGVVEEPVRFGPGRAVVIVSVQGLVLANRTVPGAARIRLTVRGPVPPLIVGDVIEVTTRLHPPRGLWNPAGYDYGAHLRRTGVHAVGSVTVHPDGTGLRILAHGFSSLMAAVDQGRARIRDAALRSLEDPIAGIYLALTTGESGYLSQDVRDAFMASGTTHILSISGSHLGLIGVVVFWGVHRLLLALPARWVLRLSRHTTATRVAAAATILPVTGYALLGGAEVATVRSLIMTLVALAAVLVGRSHSLGYSIALALVVIVGWDPLAPFDISFQLSFLSVLVIVLLMKIRHPRDEEAIRGASRERRIWETLKVRTVDVLLVSVVITLATAPLVAAYFNQLAWVGGLSNLLVVPLVGFIVLPVGLLVCLATLLSGAEGELVGAAVVRPLLEVLVWIVQTFAAVPGAELRVASPPVWQMAGFFLLLGAALLWWGRGAGRLAGVLAGGMLLLWVWSPRDLPAAGSFRVTFLDVGQGDAALVETEDGRAMLVDGGGATDAYDAGRMVIAPVLWDRGIRRLDVVVASHPQLDHVGGLVFVLSKFDVGQLWTNGVAREAAFFHRLERTLTERRVPVRAVSAADGALSLGSCQARVLNPDASERFGASTAEGARLNNQSVVLRLGCGAATVLFTGDIEWEAESRLTQQADRLETTVLKVPHHGAKGSVYEPFLRAVHPQLAVVSVGHANAYGHPSPTMTGAYARLGIPLLRTDRHGAVSVIGTPSGLQVSCQSGRQFKKVILGSGGDRKGEKSEAQNFTRWLGLSAICDNSLIY